MTTARTVMVYIFSSPSTVYTMMPWADTINQLGGHFPDLSTKILIFCGDDSNRQPCSRHHTIVVLWSCDYCHSPNCSILNKIQGKTIIEVVKFQSMNEPMCPVLILFWRCYRNVKKKEKSFKMKI